MFGSLSCRLSRAVVSLYTACRVCFVFVRSISLFLVFLVFLTVYVRLARLGARLLFECVLWSCVVFLCRYLGRCFGVFVGVWGSFGACFS